MTAPTAMLKYPHRAREHKMSNYPNMSYCMCENTMSAMRQVLSAMEDEGVEFLQNLSREERRAFQSLFDACETFLELSEQLTGELEDAERAAAEREVDND